MLIVLSDVGYVVVVIYCVKLLLVTWKATASSFVQLATSLHVIAIPRRQSLDGRISTASMSCSRQLEQEEEQPRRL